MITAKLADSLASLSRKALRDDLDDAFHIKHAAAPGAAADCLQRGPEACVVRQRRVRRKARMWSAPCENLRAFLRRETALAFANKINAPFKFAPVDDDANPIAGAHLADRSARQRFRTDVPDASAGRDTRETRVGQQRHVLAERQEFQSGG